MLRFLLPLLVCCDTIVGQTVSRPWHEALTQIRKNVSMQILRADNYICVQDLSRTYYYTITSTAPCEQPPHVPDSHPELKDRLRMDVAVSEGNEIYAWHGDKKFSSKGVMELVQHGPVSSGGFTGYLRNIFATAGIEFTYHEPTRINGQLMYRFDYRVPLKVSRYQIQSGDQMVIVPFRGSFTARADTLELDTLVVTADNDAIPKGAELCSIQATVTYKVAHISSTDSLIPSAFDIIYGSSQGHMITASHGEFSQCRQYLGESTIHFDAEDPAGADKVVSVEAASIKPGVVLRIALSTAIDSDTAYAGMQLEGALAHPAKIGSGVVLPAGTPVDGIITRFETYYEPEPQTVMVIEFNHLNAGSKSYLFRAIHPHDLYQQMQSTPGMGPRGRGGMGAGRSVSKPTNEEEPGVLRFPKKKVYLDKKFVTEYEVMPLK